jgi:hypothetical protein
MIFGGKDKLMNDIRTGFYIYPWDLLDPDPAQVITQMAGELNCNAVAVNAQYHHARLLRPRADGRKTLHYDRAVAAFEPNSEFYKDSRLLPVGDKDLVQSNVLGASQKASKVHNMDFGIWLVGLHNSTLGAVNQELCVENCFGDVYTYALCPSQERNQQYVVGLVKDVCEQFAPDRVILEAVGFLGLRHWVHHELFMTDWDEAQELLTSICFCPACIHKGTQAGIDVLALREQIRWLADLSLNEERGTLPANFTLGEIPSMLFEIEGLYEYLQSCSQSVIDLVGRVYEITKQNGIELEVIPSSFHRPSSRAYVERVSLKSLSEVCDYLSVSSYFATPAEVEADLRWTTYLAPNAKLTAGINACAPTAGAVVLEGQVAACLDVDCKGVYFYNFGLLTHKRLAWVTQANASILPGR